MNWYSQAGQDKWVIDTLGEDAGFFVDVGAYDGIEHSNTYALERFFGWTGICVDADYTAFERCLRNRTCEVFHATVGTTYHSLTWLLTYPEFQDVTSIDYLSIDVEGMDLDVLQGHDFDRWPVRLITVEHNLYLEGPARKDAIYQFLTDRGFERVFEDVVAPGYGPYEDWYVGP